MKKKPALNLSNIIAAMPCHIYWVDKDGVFLGCNDQQAKSFGLEKADDLIGKNLWDIRDNVGWSIELVEKIRRNDIDVMHSQYTLSVEEEVTWSDGTPRIYLSKKSPLYNEDGQCIGTQGLAFDITEQKNKENHLRAAKESAETSDHAKTDFITNISHDLRTPLHAVLGTTELLLLKKHLPEQAEHLNSILQSGESLLNLVENVLDFAKLEQDGLEIHTETFNLQQLINSVIITLNKQANEKNVDIIADYPTNIPQHVISDPGTLRRVLTNLTGNAIKFTHQGHIFITVQPTNITTEEMTIQLKVKDTGIGIDKKDLPQVFDRFYRTNLAHKGQYKGTGLGLAITKKLVDNLQGTITVDSEPGVGTEFTCTLTFKLDHQTDAAAYQSTENLTLPLNPSRRLTALLVEDTPMVQQFAVHIFDILGCDVTLISTGKEAIERAKQNFDIIFMDIGLPDGDGVDFIQKIRAQEKDGHHIPIVALTAHAQKSMKKQCLDAGADDFLPKPASVKDISECLHKYQSIKPVTAAED